MPADLGGKWKLDRTEGAAELIAALGISAEKIPKTVDLEITQNGEDLNFKFVSDLSTREHSVTVGKPFKETILGFEVEGDLKWDGDKLVSTSNKGSETIREIIDGELVSTMTIKGVTAKRIFKKC